MKIAVLTSGGGAPGMNGAIRAVARAAFARGWEVLGVESGYHGLLEGWFHPLDNRNVGGILHRGGTVLGTARSPEFRTPEGQKRGAQALAGAGVEGLVVIGGDGSLAGGMRLEELGIAVTGVPATIDNDVWGTDMALGVDTALNTALEAIDRIKDTASSHQRAHVVEVMGRRCGYLTLMVAIAGGAEAALVPEFDPRPEDVLSSLKQSYVRGKPHFIVVVAEGAGLTAEDLHEYINRTPGAFDSRLTVLGHIQRGGAPTAFDRILSGRLGEAAVAALADGESGTMVGLQCRKVTRVPLGEVVGRTRPLDPELYDV
ncbi:MAG TPA: 6-phosphofructokinase [Rubrobacteraceae bacterium]|nr:6-phosphofructokinase [Rubrobacteraceae bacterium]